MSSGLPAGRFSTREKHANRVVLPALWLILRCSTSSPYSCAACTLPMAAKRVGFDPAVMASPFITTIVDALSLLVYFGIASALLF